MRTWKDPDSDIVHIIDVDEGKETKPTPQQSAVLHTWPLEDIVRTFFRRITMRCGLKLQVDSDECIMPKGEALLASPPPLLRPWSPGHEAPTCVSCAVTKPFSSAWGGVRGA
jgi:hypothetical protein